MGGGLEIMHGVCFAKNVHLRFSSTIGSFYVKIRLLLVTARRHKLDRLDYSPMVCGHPVVYMTTPLAGKLAITCVFYGGPSAFYVSPDFLPTALTFSLQPSPGALSANCCNKAVEGSGEAASLLPRVPRG